MYTVYKLNVLLYVQSFVGVGLYITISWKIAEGILFSEISRKLNPCANSVYQEFLLSNAWAR